MKYADGPTVEVDTLVHAPIERVWELVTDIELPARFSSEFLGAEWLDDGPALSARFVGRNHHDAMGEWTTTSFVNRYEPTVRSAGTSPTRRTRQRAGGSSSTRKPSGVRLRQGTRMGPAPSGLSIAITAMPDKEERIIARRLQEFEQNMAATLEGIKQLAEAAA